jgi:uncharacterized iron-regulated membrane protein
MLRAAVVAIHRYAGLGMAVFLVLVGLSGSLIAWEDEIDAWLNPQLFLTSHAIGLPIPELAERFEQAHPGVQLFFLQEPAESGHTVKAYVRNWPAPGSGRSLNQVFIDPLTAEVLGARSTIAPGMTREEIVPWIYRFHYSLTMGSAGSYLVGIVSLVWLVDCFLGLWLTLPRGRPFLEKWRVSWGVRRKRLNFDLHRASGLWLWPVLLVLAFSGIYFNLFREVFTPVMNAVSSITPRPYNDPSLPTALDAPQMTWIQAAEIAQRQIKQRVPTARMSNMGYDAYRGYYRAGFHTPEDPMASAGGAHVYVNAVDGSIRAIHLPGQGTVADVIMEWQFPLHSGQAFGVVGRVIISLAGLFIAVLSVTGVILWWRKRFGVCRGPRSRGWSPKLGPSCCEARATDGVQWYRSRMHSTNKCRRMSS